MKKIIILGLLSISVIFTGCIFAKNKNNNTNGLPILTNQTVNSSTNSQDNGQTQYRKVTITGSLALTPNPPAGYKGLVMTPAGTVNMTFWFPADGGEAVKQNNTVALSSYEGIPIGGAASCVCTIDEAAMAPSSFTISASLEPNASATTDIKTNELTEQKDSVDFHFESFPVMEAIDYTCQCLGPPSTQSDYTAAYSGLLAPFYYTKYGVYIKPDGIADVSEFKDSPIKSDRMPIPYLLDMDLTTTEEWVDDLN